MSPRKPSCDWSMNFSALSSVRHRQLCKLLRSLLYGKIVFEIIVATFSLYFTHIIFLGALQIKLGITIFVNYYFY